MTHNDYQIINTLLLMIIIGAGIVCFAVSLSDSIFMWLDKRKTKKHFKKRDK